MTSRHQGQHQGDDAGRKLAGGEGGRQHRQHHRKQGEAEVLQQVRAAYGRQIAGDGAHDEQREAGEERNPESVSEDREGDPGRELVGREDAAVPRCRPRRRSRVGNDQRARRGRRPASAVPPSGAPPCVALLFSGGAAGIGRTVAAGGTGLGKPARRVYIVDVGLRWPRKIRTGR